MAAVMIGRQIEIQGINRETEMSKLTWMTILALAQIICPLGAAIALWREVLTDD